MTAILITAAVFVGVLVLAELSARLWRVRRPTDDRLTRFRQWRVASAAWMLAVCGVFALLVATHVLVLRA